MAAFRTGEFFEGVIELLFKFWNGIGEVRWAEVFSVDKELLFREGDREALLGGFSGNGSEGEVEVWD